MNIQKQKELTSFFEGRSTHAYQDSKGFWTIGFGRNIDKRGGPGLRESEMHLMLENDLTEVEALLEASLEFYTELKEPRKAVLIDMAYNMGVHGLLKFRTMLGCLKLKDYQGAANAMIRSKWKTDVGPRRWKPLFEMMSSGEWVALK